MNKELVTKNTIKKISNYYDIVISAKTKKEKERIPFEEIILQSNGWAFVVGRGCFISPNNFNLEMCVCKFSSRNFKSDKFLKAIESGKEVIRHTTKKTLSENIDYCIAELNKYMNEQKAS